MKTFIVLFCSVIFASGLFAASEVQPCYPNIQNDTLIITDVKSRTKLTLTTGQYVEIKKDDGSKVVGEISELHQDYIQVGEDKVPIFSIKSIRYYKTFPHGNTLSGVAGVVSAVLGAGSFGIGIAGLVGMSNLSSDTTEDVLELIILGPILLVVAILGFFLGFLFWTGALLGFKGKPKTKLVKFWLNGQVLTNFIKSH
ncbi:MAG: hypothetical protein KDE26_08795 [Bacteroidetes bacterium]|nr:hypothetical protein [Bacteroidota bacterium]MCB0843336.1 hypothetical protein [Bacteroidota bacterium]